MLFRFLCFLNRFLKKTLLGWYCCFKTTL